ncbi:MAG: acetate--CoA ligase [Nanoarchaeota archaeon]|nr:acetate--CoA ligase [Nanoarchaeota archaeon]
MDPAILHIQDEGRRFPPPEAFKAKARIKSLAEYHKLYEESIHAPEQFWARQAKELAWMRPWNSVFDWDKETCRFTWFRGGKLNVSSNCLDRHLETQGEKVAILWQGEREEDKRRLTYRELHDEVCRFANVLKKKGVQKGDRVCVYLPMIPEAVIAMLACTRIGAIHSVVFAGFSSAALKDRLDDSKAKVLITADGGRRSGKEFDLKGMADAALTDCQSVEQVIVVQHIKNNAAMKKGRDVYWHDEMRSTHGACPATEMDAEDPLFILYTSGTTGKPKGALHTTAGYLLYTYLTYRYIFDYSDKDIYWCTADVGWVTGHSYIVYGPLANGATVLMFEGVPTYPDNDRFWQIVENYKVSVLYTAPTALRALMRFGDGPVKKHDLSSLRLLGSVGEPINPEAWMWYHTVIGGGRCPIVDTWWQTETGGILISPLPGAMTLKPGCACRPFFGVRPVVYNEEGGLAQRNEGGYLAITHPWPGLMRTVWGNHDRYIETYWDKYKGEYSTGDAARVDENGDIWLMGRVDDVIKVSGHRLGTAEVESALVSHPSVAEAGVVGRPHPIKGQCLYAFVTLKHGIPISEQLKQELIQHVSTTMGPIAKPDFIQFAEGLPKTRSGKIMRRILKAIASGEADVGNTTTLADPSVVEELVKNRVA